MTWDQGRPAGCARGRVPVSVEGAGSPGGPVTRGQGAKSGHGFREEACPKCASGQPRIVPQVGWEARLGRRAWLGIGLGGDSRGPFLRRHPGPSCAGCAGGLPCPVPRSRLGCKGAGKGSRRGRRPRHRIRSKRSEWCEITLANSFGKAAVSRPPGSVGGVRRWRRIRPRGRTGPDSSNPLDSGASSHFVVNYWVARFSRLDVSLACRLLGVAA